MKKSEQIGANQNERAQLRNRLDRIKHKLVVLSGKGGVGKSTVAVNLAVSLKLAGKRVGLLDVDIHGPSAPRMLALEGKAAQMTAEELLPVDLDGLKVMSIGFLLRSSDDAVIWRGPMKSSVIRQFLTDVSWGELDYLVIDAPPGTGDEPLSVCQMIEDIDGAIVVTTPQEVAVAAVRKSISFCRQLGLPVLGVVENMSGFLCPHCGRSSDIFKTGGGERMAADAGVPFLGSIPMDPAISEAGDSGKPYINAGAVSETAKSFTKVVRAILALAEPELSRSGASKTNEPLGKEKSMRAAIPIANGKLTMHFGHCEQFALLDFDPDTKQILKSETVSAPDHQPGLLPAWLAERGVNLVIAGGMGARAQSLFSEHGIEVIVGAPSEEPEALLKDYLTGTLETGGNVCDH